jgi:hypothetical protein
MKVEELINELKKFNKKLTVKIYIDDDDPVGDNDVGEIYLSKDFRGDNVIIIQAKEVKK